jgi:hypothetical protein
MALFFGLVGVFFGGVFLGGVSPIMGTKKD